MTNSAPLVTDSPWFWAAMFSGIAILGLFAIGPKYLARETVVETRYTAREKIRERAANPSAITQDGSEDAVEEAVEDATAQPRTLIVPIWPVQAAMAVILAISCLQLWRIYRPPPSAGTPPS